MTRRLLATAALAVACLAPAAAAYVVEYYDPQSGCTYTVWVLEGEPVKTRIACR